MFHRNEKQNEAGDNQNSIPRHAIAPATLTTASSVLLAVLLSSVIMLPHPPSPWGQEKRQIAAIDRDHRTPNEPLWPICSQTQAFVLRLVWSHRSRATLQWVISQRPTPPLLFPRRTNKLPNDILSSSPLLQCSAVYPFVIFRTRREEV
jgi:hypothetical protein